MKAKISLLATLPIVSLLMAAPSYSATRYHLICRGSSAGNTSLHLENYPNPDQGGVMSTDVAYFFERYKGTKASVKTDGSHLSAGQCSWSTDVLSSAYSKMLYTIKTSKIQVVGVIQPTIDKQLGVFKEGSLSDVQYWVFDSGDPNQSFIPTVVNNMAVDGVKGSIFDETKTFHFYVTINPDDSLQLQYIK